MQQLSIVIFKIYVIMLCFHHVNSAIGKFLIIIHIFVALKPEFEK